MRKRSREKFHEVTTAQDIPLQLILNYDQTWVNAFRDPKTVIRKKRAAKSKNETRITKISGGRQGLSLCTSSWASGERGPLFISLTSKGVPDKWLQSMNEHFGLNAINSFFVSDPVDGASVSETEMYHVFLFLNCSTLSKSQSFREKHQPLQARKGQICDP